jgi:hypothetical protein
VRPLGWVWIGGALLIILSAAVRSAKGPPVRVAPKLVAIQVESPPAEILAGDEDLPTEETPPLEEFAIVESVPDSQGALLSDMLVFDSVPEDDPRRLVTESWDSWREQAIAALPEHLREDSEHRKGIDETYRAAIANLGGAEKGPSARGVRVSLQYKVESLRTHASLALLQAADLVASESTAVSVESLLVDLATVAESN